MSDYCDYQGKPVNEEDLIQPFSEFVDEISSTVNVLGHVFTPSRVLRVMDVFAWQRELNRYIDERIWHDGDGPGDYHHHDLLFESEEDARAYRRDYLGEDDE